MIRVHSWQRTLRLLSLIAGDCVIAAAAVVAAVEFRRRIGVPGTESLLPPEKFPLDAINVGAAILTLIVALAANGFYAQRITARHRPMMTVALLVQVVLLTLASTLLQRPYPRTILFAQPLLESALLLMWRRIFAIVLPLRKRRAVLVGSSGRIREFLLMVNQQQDARVEFVGWIAAEHADAEALPLPRIGAVDDGGTASVIHDADELVAITEDPALRLRLFQMRGSHGYLAVPSHADALLANPNFAWLGDEPLVEIAARGADGMGEIVKRSIDIVIALVLLAMLLPVMLTIAVAVVTESGGPLFHSQLRRGKAGRTFRILKFRTMISRSADAPASVTRVGRWLRRYRLDELPQLINVIRGDMSLVGPRPERTEIHDALSQSVEGFALRLLVRPGATGLAQVSSDYETTAATKLRYDLSYICAWSVWLDFRILLRSIATSLSGRGV